MQERHDHRIIEKEFPGVLSKALRMLAKVSLPKGTALKDICVKIREVTYFCVIYKYQELFELVNGPRASKWHRDNFTFSRTLNEKPLQLISYAFDLQHRHGQSFEYGIESCCTFVMHAWPVNK